MKITTSKSLEDLLKIVEADVKTELENEINKVLDEHYAKLKGKIAQRIMNECVIKSNMIMDACSSMPEFKVSLTFKGDK
jgi:hypothetical protein